MLDQTYAALQAAIGAHTALGTAITGLAREWADMTRNICPDFPDCSHPHDIETHAVALTRYLCAQELLARVGRGKICVACHKPIPDPELLPDTPERCLLHQDPG